MLMESNIKKYGVPWYVQSDDFKKKTKTTNGTSREEKEIVQWLKSFIYPNDIAIGTFKVIPPK